jgi:hypothetical protein
VGGLPWHVTGDYDLDHSSSLNPCAYAAARAGAHNLIRADHYWFCKNQDRPWRSEAIVGPAPLGV